MCKGSGKRVRLSGALIAAAAADTTRGLPADLVKTVRQEIWSRFPSKPAAHLLITVSVNCQ